MESTYRQWYEPCAEDGDDDHALGERDADRAGQQRNQSTNSGTASRYPDLDLTSHTFTMPDLPPSLLAATEDYLAAAAYDPVNYDRFSDALAEDEGTYDQAAASTPFSFHHRSLQLPQMSDNLFTWLDESYLNASPSQRIDSAVGSVDGLSEMADTMSAAEEKDHDASHPSRSLQYHLIQMKSRAELKENLIPSPISSSAAPSPLTNEDNRTISCHICLEKQYTGTWAHRNLSRHMETMHAPCSVPDSTKQIRCSHQGCDKKFNRKDARLVHERKSHPNLNRSPPMKRKRSEDL